MERFFSTVPFGLLAICLGSVTAGGTGKVWAARVLIGMAMANAIRARMNLLESETYKANPLKRPANELGLRRYCDLSRSVILSAAFQSVILSAAVTSR